MNQYKAHSQQTQILMVTVIVAIALSVIAACNTPEQQATTNRPNEQAANVGTVTVTGTPAWQLTREAFITQVADNRATRDVIIEPTRLALAQTSTAIAMTPQALRPTDTPYPVEPTPTIAMGIMEDCCARNGYPYLTTGGWVGSVNGEVISVVTGGVWHDTQGLVLIFNSPTPLQPPTIMPNNIYSTPLKIGAVHVASVEGTRLTLAQDDPPYPNGTPRTSTTMVFDVATRQFVSP